MGSSQVQICNMALGAFGQRSIASITEQSENARKCNLFYDQARIATLRGSPWVFATRIETLVLINGQTIPGWNYLYAYPPKAVAILKVYPGETGDLTGRYYDRQIYNEFGPYDDYDRKHQLSDPFRIVQDPTDNVSAQAIATDSNPAYVEYTRDEKNNDLFDANFVEAFTYKLAAMIAKPISGDDGIVRDMIGLYQATIDKATRLNAQQGFSRPTSSSTTVNSR